MIKISAKDLVPMFDRIIDAHIHLDRYTPDERSLILHEMEASGVDELITVSNDLDSARKICSSLGMTAA